MSSAIQDLMDLKAKLGADVDALKEQYVKAKADYDAIVRSIELLESQVSEYLVPREIPIAVADIDFAGAENLSARLERIAGGCNGLINITKAAEVLIQAEQSRAKKSNLRSSIYRKLNEDIERWIKVAPGTFKLNNDEDSESPSIFDLALRETQY
jgi:hypothetical protein